MKYEEVYLRAYDTVADARASIGRYFGFYNSRRPHSSLDRKTPGLSLPQQPAACRGGLSGKRDPLIQTETLFR